MNDQTWQMSWFVLIALLPMVPSIALYLVLPSSSGDIEGPWKGIKIKFSGAVACYLVIFFTLFSARPQETNHYDTWVIRGVVSTQLGPGEDEPNLNDLYVRFVPPRLDVMNQGTFEWQIPVLHQDGRVSFPAIQLDLRGFRGLTVPLGPTAYGAANLEQDRDEKSRTITLKKPLMMISTKVGKSYSGAMK